MTQKPSPHSSTMPRGSHVRKPSRRPRLRSVLLVSFVSSMVAVALGVTGAIGLWYRAQPTADSTVQDQSDQLSLQTVAGRALTGARDLGGFVRHSASRDLSMVIRLLHSEDEEEDERGALTNRDGWRRRNGAHPTPAATRAQARSPITSSSGGRPRSLSQAEAHTLTGDTAARAAPALIDPTLLSLFDSRDRGVTPPLMHEIRLRSDFLQGPASPTRSGESGLVEVVVSATGTVESAKFLSTPLNVHESMLLSAVKAWRFRPAMRDGRAIRFRLTLPISRARI